MPVTIHVEFPEGFDDYAWEVEAKGWFPNVVAIVNQQRYTITFYDPTRLAQDIEEEFSRGAMFLERNLVVVPAVTRVHMEKAIGIIAASGRCADMVPG